jgi:mxaA protein
MTRFLAVALLLGASTIVRPAAGPSDEAGIAVTLRDTGYMLGDLLDEHIELTLQGSQRIDPESLPLPGRVAPWLEVRSTRLGPRTSQGTQELIVTYQIFAVTDQAARAPVPAFKLKLRDGADVRVVSIPAQSFLLSPALPSALTDRDRELRPSPEPGRLPLARQVAAMFACLALALACAGWLLWRYDRLPFLPYAPGPLARTWRRWRRRDAADADALLRDVHAALSQSAGETLYPSTLHRLFERAPFLLPLRERIESLFDASWNAFYGTANDAPAASSALALLRDAADRERGVPC